MSETATLRSALQSFWMAGFEGADHGNSSGLPLDMVGVTGHADAFELDYGRLAAIGMRTIRESVGWRLADPAGSGRPTFSRALAMSRSAERNGLQILWTLMHYGTPPDVSLLDDSFIERFVDFAAAAARALRPYQSAAPIYSPINEISYLAWAVCETSKIHPYFGDHSDPRRTRALDGFDVKRRLVRATLAAMAAIRHEDRRARFMHVDPVIHVVAKADAEPSAVEEASRFREFQWQAWDMLAGRLEPELGGKAAALDLIGVNHYVTAQWEFGSGNTLAWPEPDPRRRPFADLLADVWQRYERPIVIAETGHFGPLRGRWLLDVHREVRTARRRGIPVAGLCLYPIIDRPDWDDPSQWHRSGLWDAHPPTTDDSAARPDAPTASVGRYIDAPYADALQRCRDDLLDSSSVGHSSTASHIES